MLERISNLLKPVPIIKISQIILLSFVCVLMVSSLVLADGVNLNLEVKERKPTDTINDFQLSPVVEATFTAQVLGAQSQRQNNSSANFKQALHQILIYHIICWLI